MTITRGTVEQWLHQKLEAENLEFKEAKQSFDREKLFKYCIALANERGGQIVLGITE